MELPWRNCQSIQLRGFNVTGKPIYNFSKENKVPMNKFNRKSTNLYEKTFKTLIIKKKMEKLENRKGGLAGR